MNANFNHPTLYVKAHLLGSLTSAVRLAEKVSSQKNIAFAENLLTIKRSSADIKLRLVNECNKERILKSAKYDILSIKLSNIKSSQGLEKPASFNFPPPSQQEIRKVLAGLKARSVERQNKQLSVTDKLDDRHVTQGVASKSLSAGENGENRSNRDADIHAKTRHGWVAKNLNAEGPAQTHQVTKVDLDRVKFKINEKNLAHLKSKMNLLQERLRPEMHQFDSHYLSPEKARAVGKADLDRLNRLNLFADIRAKYDQALARYKLSEGMD